MRLIIFFIALILAIPVFGEVLFEDNFDSSANWTVTQPTGSDTSCYSGSCGVPGGWTGYYNGACYCDALEEPGNNNVYINQYAGYPAETNTCRGGSGKCATFWEESCTATFANSDGQLSIDLGEEYESIYLRYYIRFKDGWERKALSGDDGFAKKLYHIQHYDSGNPSSYFGANTGNQPVSSGGLKQYSTSIEFYAENRCYETYYCHGITVWNLGTTTWAYQAGGIFDGDWHSLEIRLVRNSVVGTADGVMELWYDGTKISPLAGYNNTDYEFTDTGSDLRGFRFIAIGGNNNNQFDMASGTMADREQWYAIDDVVVSTEYIGTDYVINNGGPPPITSASGFIISGGRIN